MESETDRTAWRRVQLDTFLSQVIELTRAYDAGCRAFKERAARRVFIAGVRVAALEFAANVIGRAPCSTWKWTIALAWRTYHRQRRRYLGLSADPRFAPLRPTK
jgi:hypothetical protein